MVLFLFFWHPIKICRSLVFTVITTRKNLMFLRSFHPNNSLTSSFGIACLGRSASYSLHFPLLKSVPNWCCTCPKIHSFSVWSVLIGYMNIHRVNGPWNKFKKNIKKRTLTFFVKLSFAALIPVADWRILVAIATGWKTPEYRGDGGIIKTQMNFNKAAQTTWIRLMWDNMNKKRHGSSDTA